MAGVSERRQERDAGLFPSLCGCIYVYTRTVRCGALRDARGMKARVGRGSEGGARWMSSIPILPALPPRRKPERARPQGERPLYVRLSHHIPIPSLRAVCLRILYSIYSTRFNCRTHSSLYNLNLNNCALRRVATLVL